jgi:transcriptional regulator with GAF, ATPase, and Fis domain
MQYRVPFRFCGTDDSGESRIRQSLSLAGLELTSFENSVAEAHGIIVFGDTDHGLVAFTQSFRSRAVSRVLALAVSKSVLGSGDVWRLLHAGAADVMEWSEEAVAHQIFAKVERYHLLEKVTVEALANEPIVGESQAWRELVRRVVEAGRFSSAPVLLTGESGTGKELLARLVHAVIPRRGTGRESAEPITVDCTTIVPELSGSELFGHEKGAFTGAHNVRDGAFALANEGTLFLDEVGELPLPLQAQLLRAIQEGTYKRVGGNIWLKTTFRLVCATNRDLKDLVRRGQFRLDLYHRIAGWVFRTLRIEERRDDILPLARYFLSTVFPREQPEIDGAVCEYR